MSKKNSNLGNLLYLIKNLGRFVYEFRITHPARKEFGKYPSTSSILPPCNISNIGNIFIEDYVTIKPGLRIINTPQEKVTIKRYSSLAADCTIVTNSHTATVSIPIFLLAKTFINDRSADVTIGEEVWLGTRSTILAGSSVGRGSIIAAGSVVTKSVPPYALVAGVPAKIIAVKFSLEDIERHEAALYPPKERMTHEELENLFATYYSDKKVFGCSTPLTTEQIAVLESMKAKRNLKEYPNFNMK